MEYLIIEVPRLFDSVSRIVIREKVYYIRFVYNDTMDYWKFDLYDENEEPIIIGVKIVPQFPLNLFYGITEIPDGLFAVLSNLERIGKEDLWNDKAKFIFVENQ